MLESHPRFFSDSCCEHVCRCVRHFVQWAGDLDFSTSKQTEPKGNDEGILFVTMLGIWRGQRSAAESECDRAPVTKTPWCAVTPPFDAEYLRPSHVATNANGYTIPDEFTVGREMFLKNPNTRSFGHVIISF